MLEIEGIKRIKKIAWPEIEPGMILLGGVKINGRIPPELQGFPVLTAELLEGLVEQYRLRGQREILVAQCLPGVGARQLSLALQQNQQQLEKVNIFRHEYFKYKQGVLSFVPGAPSVSLPLWQSPLVQQGAAAWRRLNSLPQFPFGGGLPLPSFFHRPGLDLSLGDLLTNKIKAKFYLPADKEILLHLVVDYSPAMLVGGRLEAVVAGLNFLNRYLPQILQKARFRCYGFSSTCRPLIFPLSGCELKREDSCYATWMKKVLHFKNKEVRNLVILFTAGPPADPQEALPLGRLFEKNKLDYLQILLEPSAANLPACAEFARACGGNQVVLGSPALAGVLGGECIDRYLGLLTLALSPPGSQLPAFLQPASPAVLDWPSAAEEKPPDKFRFPDGKVKKVVKWTQWYKDKQEP